MPDHSVTSNADGFTFSELFNVFRRGFFILVLMGTVGAGVGTWYALSILCYRTEVLFSVKEARQGSMIQEKDINNGLTQVFVDSKRVAELVSTFFEALEKRPNNLGLAIDDVTAATAYLRSIIGRISEGEGSEDVLRAKFADFLQSNWLSGVGMGNRPQRLSGLEIGVDFREPSSWQFRLNATEKGVGVALISAFAEALKETLENYNKDKEHEIIVQRQARYSAAMGSALKGTESSYQKYAEISVAKSKTFSDLRAFLEKLGVDDTDLSQIIDKSNGLLLQDPAAVEHLRLKHWLELGASELKQQQDNGKLSDAAALNAQHSLQAHADLIHRYRAAEAQVELKIGAAALINQKDWTKALTPPDWKTFAIPGIVIDAKALELAIAGRRVDRSSILPYVWVPVGFVAMFFATYCLLLLRAAVVRIR